VGDNNSYFFVDTTYVHSGTEHDIAYEPDLTDTNIYAEETIHDGEESDLRACYWNVYRGKEHQFLTAW